MEFLYNLLSQSTTHAQLFVVLLAFALVFLLLIVRHILANGVLSAIIFYVGLVCSALIFLNWLLF